MRQFFTWKLGFAKCPWSRWHYHKTKCQHHQRTQKHIDSHPSIPHLLLPTSGPRFLFLVSRARLGPVAITKMSGSSKLSEKRSSSYCRLDLGLKSRHAVAANLVHKPLFDPSAWLSSEIYLHTQTQQANGRHCFASSCDACFTKSFFFSVRKSPQTKFRNTEKNKISISWKLLKNLQLLIFFLPHILQVAEA